jgi:hypothetical protein
MVLLVILDPYPVQSIICAGSRRTIPGMLVRRQAPEILDDWAKSGCGGGLADDQFGCERLSLGAAAAAKPLQH